jgi:hypothetical protein
MSIMSRISKSLALVLIFTTAILSLSLLMVKPVIAQSISKPSAPEFTVKMVDRSYDVPLTYINSTNPYTGQQVTSTQGGYHVENQTIDVTIKNQPFTPTNIDGNITQMFYVIRWKGHFENWTNTDDFNDIDYNYYLNNYGVQASNSDFTVKTYTLASIGNVPEGGQVDFQVKAQIGYSFEYFGGHIMPIGTDFQYVQESDWSNTQTLTINYNSNSTASSTSPNPTSSPTPTSTPAVPEFTWLMVLPLVLSTFAFALYRKCRERKA